MSALRAPPKCSAGAPQMLCAPPHRGGGGGDRYATVVGNITGFGNRWSDALKRTRKTPFYNSLNMTEITIYNIT